jgi:hypothetical protein
MSTFYAVSFRPLAPAGEHSEFRRMLALLAVWAIVGIAMTLSVALAFGPEIIGVLASG